MSQPPYDTGTHSWTAALLRTVLPAPGGGSSPPAPGTPSPTPTPEPARTIPGAWTLNMTSDYGDSIGAGRTWSHGPPDDTLGVIASRRFVGFYIKTDAEFQGGCTATFTIHEIAFDPSGALRTFRADFEQHCPARHLGVPRRLTESSGLRSRRNGHPACAVEEGC